MAANRVRVARTLFPEDVVVRTRGSVTVTGIVDRVGGQSDDEEESDASGDEGALEEGEASVRWLSSGKSEVEQVSDLRVVDRVFVQGDIVAPADGQHAQSGTVVDISLALDVRLPSGAVREFVPSSLLSHIKPFRPGTYAVHGTWLGRVDECMEHVTLAFPDGARVKLARALPEDVTLVQESFDEHCPFFPSQLLKGKPRALKRGKWLVGRYRREYAGQIAVVQSVQACDVSAASAPPAPAARRTLPPRAFGPGTALLFPRARSPSRPRASAPSAHQRLHPTRRSRTPSLPAPLRRPRPRRWRCDG